MNAIQLHDREEETEPEIYEFVSKNWDICEMLYVEFYQPR